MTTLIVQVPPNTMSTSFTVICRWWSLSMYTSTALSNIRNKLVIHIRLHLRPFFKYHCDNPSTDNVLTDSSLHITNRQPSLITASFPINIAGTHRFLPLRHTRYSKCLVPVSNSTPSSTVIPLKWKLFWKLQIPLHARTVWHRSIHRKLLTNSFSILLPTAFSVSHLHLK
ncbi:hypothetical protein BDB01DRAFT_831780 [Pilobolus umbonatus]|nr:hypothetical protein BDB01DRAFT_831780 [Pilobolus umbonatus]